jgi:glycine cleavage system H protein
LTGTITAVNSALDATPELINQDPYTAGWIAEISVTESATDLLSSTEYITLTA